MIKKKYCTSDTCPSMPKCIEVDHRALGVEVPAGMTAQHIRFQCQTCGHETLDVVPKVTKKKRSWPYHNDSEGVTFESESHEKHYVKENNLTAV